MREPDWPNSVTPSGRMRCPQTEPSQPSVAGWPSITVTRVQWRGRGASKLSACARAVALPRARARCAAVGRVIMNATAAPNSEMTAPACTPRVTVSSAARPAGT